MGRWPTAPAATATAVTVRRPRQCTQPVTSVTKLRKLGAQKQGSNAVSRPRNDSGTMLLDMAPSLMAAHPQGRLGSHALPSLGWKMAEVESSRLGHGSGTTTTSGGDGGCRA